MRLDVVDGSEVGESILVESELMIGRQVEGPGRLSDEEISRAHARVWVDPDGMWTIEDLASTNGTFVNGVRITAPKTLKEDDTIELGSTTIVVRELVGSSLEEPAADFPHDRTIATEIHSMPPGVDPQSQAPPAVLPVDPQAPPPVAPVDPHAPPPHVPADDPWYEPGEPLAVEFSEHPSREEPFSEPSRPTLSMRLEIDFAATETRIWLEGSPDPIRLVLEAGEWRVATGDRPPPYRAPS
jgi:FHA domain